MYQKDYLLRYIEQLAKAVSRILNKKNEGDIEGAEVMLEQHYRETLGLTKENAIQHFNPDDFLRYLSENFEPKADELETLAKLVDADAQILEARGEQQAALHRYKIGLNLIQEAENKDPKTFSLDRQAFINQFQARIENLAKFEP